MQTPLCLLPSVYCWGQGTSCPWSQGIFIPSYYTVLCRLGRGPVITAEEYIPKLCLSTWGAKSVRGGKEKGGGGHEGEATSRLESFSGFSKGTAV